MCGIVGLVGKKDVKVKDIISGLQKLEYRGYDSAGIAFSKNEHIELIKATGKISNLKDELNDRINANIHIGIAHTRWATHGGVTDLNAHPHTDCTGKIALVHNGIIENFQELRKELIEKGHRFKSETDTEVIAHLIEEYYNGDLFKSVLSAIKRLDGAYAIGVIHTDEKKIVSVRKGSPLVVAYNEDYALLASDITPLIKYTKDVYFMNDNEIALLEAGKIEFYNIDGEKIEKSPTHIDWDEQAAEKSGYEHFMLKEMNEQPEALKSAITGRIKNGKPIISEINNLKEFIKKDLQKIFIVACGTSYHAGMAFKYFMNKYSRISVDIEVASEFRYMNPHVDQNTLVLAISQSGETIDTLEGIRIAKEKGAKVITISNVFGSTIPRESHGAIYMNTGPEIGVAATKTYTAQIAILYALGAKIIELTEGLNNEIESILKGIEEMPEIYKKVLKLNEKIKELAREYSNYQHMMYIGRGFGYPTALEGALKLKEISYIHAAGYQAGELKHGPIALLDEQFPVFAIIPKDSLYEKMKSNLMESKARNANIIAISTEGNDEIKHLTDEYILVPKTHEALYPLVMAPVIQLFAYNVAVLRKLDPDKPRNLAKSVTVE
ncbi:MULTISPECIES: glutamine--fructose-6-phosphate transaminase (isomerizing) [unclassified Marinitoga]|uniref:glutamine--fructose-6-phosphate transaminase (isomerizing) n=1 Tax=unclassified Marinitoga TaxID=2640159 RepID=UPI00064135B5|nr:MULTISPECIES: glutamine--fructose-6-phosphate transaminase (isomerizing) [unclassified Marinitoga]KLO23901.1 glucosamine--fructose-6-phosphate aminotransferase [Marinitoga sp. 1155]NUU99122.1 glucosamine--fructose-6-phosphate aminotransferase [Marinitoga sp. 1154]